MTKTLATTLARKALQYGHYSTPDGLEQRCPQCSERVLSPRVMGRTDVKRLRAEMVDHLQNWCGQ